MYGNLIQLAGVLAVVTLVYFLVPRNPFLAGLAAMIPVKSLAAIYLGRHNLEPVVSGMVGGALLTALSLCILWMLIARS